MEQPFEDERSNAGLVEEPPEQVAEENLFETYMRELLAMGFDERDAKGTLLFFGCDNFEEVVQMLLNGEGVPYMEQIKHVPPPLARDASELSLIQPYGSYTGRCGYCSGHDTSSKFAFRSRRLLVEDYEFLLEKDFSRSGTWTYHPFGDRSCCQLYQIRLDVEKFVPSAVHQKTLKKVGKYLKGIPNKEPKKKKVKTVQEDENAEKLSKAVLKTLEQSFPDCVVPQKIYIRIPQNASQKYSIPISLIVNVLKKQKSKDEVCRAFKENWKEAVEAMVETEYVVFDLKKEFPKEQRTNKDQRNSDREPEIAQEKKLTVEIEEPEFTQEKFELYKKYQQSVHSENDKEITEEGFIRFICTTPLVRQKPRDDGDHPYGLGSAHLMFRIDGKLVGCSQIDLLPTHFCSNYFFWDTDYRFLNLGTFSQLKEMEFMKKCSNLKYYNLMWSSPCSKKMGYKTKMKGTEILCPFTHTWHDYQTVRAKIEEHGHARLAGPEVPDDYDNEPPDPAAIYDFYVQYNGVVKPYLDVRIYLQDQAERFDKKLRDLLYLLGQRVKTFIIEV